MHLITALEIAMAYCAVAILLILLARSILP